MQIKTRKQFSGCLRPGSHGSLALGETTSSPEVEIQRRSLLGFVEPSPYEIRGFRVYFERNRLFFIAVLATLASGHQRKGPRGRFRVLFQDCIQGSLQTPLLSGRERDPLARRRWIVHHAV